MLPALRRSAPWAVGLVVSLLLSGCASDQSTLEPASPQAHDIAVLWWVMLVGSVVVFAVVVALLLVGVLRRRGGDAGRLASLGTPFVAIAGVAVPAVVLVALFALTLATLPDTSAGQTAVGGKAGVVVEVTGRQWFWDVTYPGTRVRTANEIHLPVGVPAEIRVRTRDVVHSFWVPRLDRKIDMIPGRTNVIRFTPRQAGAFRGQCAEFCGLQHAHMAFWVVVEPLAKFRAWLAHQSAPPPEPENDLAARGQQVFLGSACVYCHTIAGTNASGRVGPDLTHLASRLSLAAGTLPNSKGYLAGWILDPQHVKPGNKMPATGLSGEELQALLAYLETLR